MYQIKLTEIPCTGTIEQTRLGAGSKQQNKLDGVSQNDRKSPMFQKKNHLC